MSELMDPEDLRDVISSYQNACKQHVNRYGGYIARYMGDGLLVYFGYPTAHERDPERAVRAGLDIVTDIGSKSLPDNTPLQVRVGIATGLVVVGDLIGEGASEERAVLGDTPNLAARLQGLAAPGTVCVSEATYALLSKDMGFEDLGPHSLKGISEPVNAYRAMLRTTLQTHPTTSPQTPFIGRETQLNTLKQQWSRATTGHGKIVALIGEPGFGKTRLITAFKTEIEDAPHRVLEIKASEFHQDSSFRPIRQMLEQTLNAYDQTFSNTPSKTLNKWLSSFTSLNEDSAFVLHRLMDISIDETLTHNLDGAALKIRTLDTLIDLFVALSVDQPLLTIIDDAQWLDASTTDFMARLVSLTSMSSSLVLIAARPEFTPPWDQVLDVTHISLERLNSDHINQLISKISGEKRLPDQIRDSLIEHADGIPLYIEELTRSVLEAHQSEQWDENISPITVPTSLQDSLMARLDRLGSAKLIAQKAAVIGRVLDRKLLQAICQADNTDVDQGLLELLSSDLLVPRPDIGDGMFEFRHALIRDIAYQSLLIRRRKEIHEHVATALLQLNPLIKETEPEAIALQYTEAGIFNKAQEFWTAAADKAAARWANVEAIAHYKKALSALGNTPDDAPQQEVNLLLNMVGCMRITDRYDDAFVALDQAEIIANTNHFTPQLIQINYLRGNLSFAIGDFKNCVQLHTQARDLAQKSGASDDEARAESGLGDATFFSCHIKIAEHHYDNSITIARRENFPAIEISNLALRGHMRLYLNQFDQALKDCRQTIKLAVNAENRRAEMVARGSCLAKILYELGQWDEADEQLVWALDIAKSLGARRYIPMYLCFRAKIAITTGRAENALELASSAVDLNRQGHFIFAAPMALGTLARATPNQTEADAYIAEGEAMLDQGSMSQNHFWYRLDAMELGLKRNDPEMVEHHAEALRSVLTTVPPAWATFHIRRCLLLSKIASGHADDTVKTELSALLKEAESRNQASAASTIKAALQKS